MGRGFAGCFESGRGRSREFHGEANEFIAKTVGGPVPEKFFLRTVPGDGICRRKLSSFWRVFTLVFDFRLGLIMLRSQMPNPRGTSMAFSILVVQFIQHLRHLIAISPFSGHVHTEATVSSGTIP